MKNRTRHVATLLLTGLVTIAIPQGAAGQTEAEALKLAALEALMSAPEERALPIVERVLAGNDSTMVKQRALFVLAQVDLPEAQDLLLTIASGDDPELATEAIRMLGINGDSAGMDRLGELYANGSPEVREAVFEAWVIAGDPEPVYAVAANAQSEAEFARAVDTLGAMGAIEELRALRDVTGYSERLIQALSVASDLDTLTQLANDDSDPRRQVQAIRSIGIVGGDEADALLVSIYRNTGSESARQAAMHGLMIAGHDEGVLELYRASSDPAEKRQLLRVLAAMDSDAAWEAIDAALSEGSQ